MRAVARLITIVEEGQPQLREVLAALAPYAGHAHLVGLTGSPGVGKSTTTNALVGELRRRGQRVAVLAVDPSSPFSGGALLGDRIRMTEHSMDPLVYIRSMANRGHLGGLSRAAPQALRVLDGCGFDIVLVETVGVGQSEVEIAGLADTNVVLLAPGMGDGIQAAKAGILEIGDIFVVNKADRAGADSTVRELRHLTTQVEAEPGGWRVPVLKAVATESAGIPELADALTDHLTWLGASGGLASRRQHRVRSEIEAIALATLRARLRAPAAGLDRLTDEVLAGALDPHAAAAGLLDRLS